MLCPDAPTVASALELILNQRLVRQLCPQCEGAGCVPCLQTGYHGRVPAVESLRVADETRQRIAARDLTGITVAPSLLDNARALAQSKLTNEAELKRVFGAA